MVRKKLMLLGLITAMVLGSVSVNAITLGGTGTKTKVEDARVFLKGQSRQGNIFMRLLKTAEETIDVDELVTEMEKYEAGAYSSSGVVTSSNEVITIEAGASVSDDFLQAVINNYNKLPANYRAIFEENNGQVIISATDLGLDNGRKENTILAFTYPERFYIKLDNRNAAKSSVLHEMMHVIDYKAGWVSQSDEFTVIYNSEVNAFRSVWKTDSQNTSNATEYLGEAFMVYINNPDLLRDSCPLTYDYIVNFIANL